MKFLRTNPSVALGLTLALAACGGVSPTAPSGFGGVSQPLAYSPAAHGKRVFAFTGKPQTFVVPAGVTSITVTALGGAGGAAFTPPQERDAVHAGALGGSVTATIPVHAGASLLVYVGGEGASATVAGPGKGGFNGGGAGSGQIRPLKGKFGGGGGGGGASDIRESGAGLPDRVIVAGGGGGSGATGGQNGTHGGGGGVGGALGNAGRPGAGGQEGTGGGGGGGTSKNGGAGGTFGSDGGGSVTGAGARGSTGARGAGGAGGAAGFVGGGGDGHVITGGGGGGGGAGFYGGGGGGGGAVFDEASDSAGLGGGGGGGGSSFVEPGATNVIVVRGDPAASGNGRITIVW